MKKVRLVLFLALTGLLLLLVLPATGSDLIPLPPIKELRPSTFVFNRMSHMPEVIIEGLTVLRDFYPSDYNNEYASTPDSTAYVIATAMEGSKYTGTQRMDFTILPKPVEKPTAAAVQTYTGELLTGVPAGEGYRLLTGVSSAVDAGEYTAEIIPSDSNFIWKDGTRDKLSLDWVIEPLAINKPSANPARTYSGWEMTGVPAGTGYKVVSGVNVAREAGNYTVTIGLANGNFVWADGTREELILDWVIKPLQVEKPIAKTPQTYTGEDLTGVRGGIGYSVSGANSARDVGTYHVTVDLLSGDYEWIGGTREQLSFDWVIQPAALPRILIVLETGESYSGAGIEPGIGLISPPIARSPDDFTVSYKNNINAGTATVTATGRGNFKGSSSAKFYIPALDHYLVNPIPDQRYSGMQIRPSFRSPYPAIPSTEYTISYGENLNVGWGSITFTPTSTNILNAHTEYFRILPMQIAKPTATTPQTYTGGELTGVRAGVGYTIGGVNSATVAETYTATVELASGFYEWLGGTREGLSLNWTIEPAELPPSAAWPMPRSPMTAAPKLLLSPSQGLYWTGISPSATRRTPRWAPLRCSSQASATTWG